jgi:sec-independent protein translocase protein TatA
VILVIILIIFGAGKLPEIGAGLGKGIKNFKKATSADEVQAGDDKPKIEKKETERED